MVRKELGKKRPPRNPILDNLPTTSFDPVGKKPQPAQSTGKMPFPIGQPVAESALTEDEKNDLSQLGWKDGDPVPATLAEHVAAAKKRSVRESEDTSTMPPPAAPDMPPLKMPEEVEIEDLPETEQARLREVLANAGDQYDTMKQATFPAGAPQGVRDAAQNRVDRRVDIPVEDDRKREEEQTQSEATTKTQTADDTGQQLCPNCGWDQAKTDLVEVTDEDKHTFLVATLGGFSWKKMYDLFDGKMQVMFRQLRPSEIDAVYTQTYAERSRDDTMEMAVYWEQLMRYRLCLQLIEFRSGDNVIGFPDALTGWEREPAKDDPTILPEIEKEVYKEVIHTESMNRILSSLVGQFGRLVAKLEVEVENPDFWKTADSPA